ncbi:MAG: CvpA family protein [Oscillospiraceae bacterium]|nr:CvpA family protein [Oscillospiraceae bacterium]
MTDTAMIIDIIFLAVLLITAIRAWIDGFFTSVIRLAGTLGSVFAGWYVSQNYTGYIFENYLRRPLTERAYNFLVQASRDIDIKTALSSVIGNWPQDFLDTVLVKAEEVMAQILVPTMDSAVYLVNEFIAPVVTACLSIVLFLVCFAAVRIVCSLLAGMFKTVNKVPVLGTANRMAGFASGLVIGCVNIILLSFLLSIIVIVTGDSLSFLNAEIIAASRVMAVTSALNPFLP